MAKSNNVLSLSNIISVDKTGMPIKPTIEQLMDSDILMLYNRDRSSDKSEYIKQCGVIYYFGDPTSPARQKGLSEEEILKECIENFDLPSTYKPDRLVQRLIQKYYDIKITPAGKTIEVLNKTLHTLNVAASKINELVNKELNSMNADDALDLERADGIIGLSNKLFTIIKSIPEYTKSLKAAYENLRNEEEDAMARGGVKISSSQSASDGQF